MVIARARFGPPTVPIRNATRVDADDLIAPPSPQDECRASSADGQARPGAIPQCGCAGIQATRLARPVLLSVLGARQSAHEVPALCERAALTLLPPAFLLAIFYAIETWEFLRLDLWWIGGL